MDQTSSNGPIGYWPIHYRPEQVPAGFDSICEFAFSITNQYGPNWSTIIQGEEYNIQYNDDGTPQCQLAPVLQYRLIEVCCTGEIFVLDITNASEEYFQNYPPFGNVAQIHSIGSTLQSILNIPTPEYNSSCGDVYGV